ncbi:MAG: dipeptidase [Planctomycetia bacterium]|nr:dipeptidase [Planctomycetia bacterium]
MKSVLSYIRKNRNAFRETWFDALRIPSISALSEHKGDMKRMADWLATYMVEELEIDACLVPTKGNPLVFGQTPHIPGAPTALVYGHYDVQPPDPLDQWITPPFEPAIRDDNVYARGADDDKGQLLCHMFSLKAWKAAGKNLPINIKYIYEGEEEIGSGSFVNFLKSQENRDMLAADVVVVSDNTMAGPNAPAICYGLRGLMGFELTLTGPSRDLHSGIYGGSVCNPAIALSKILAEIVDENGIIQVPGFYDSVLEISDFEHKATAQLPFNEADDLAAIGLSKPFGDPNFTVLERRGARPSFDINGLTSGYQGTGGKTIIPASASAKFTFRLVPNQDPKILIPAVRKFIRRLVPAGLKMKLTASEGAPGMVIPLESRFIKAGANALKKAFGKRPVFVRDGGSIPVVAALNQSLGADVLLMGLGLLDDAIHSPNEKFPLNCFYRGMEASAQLWNELGQLD